MSEPIGEYLRRGQVLSWLEELGIARRATRELIECKVIKGRSLSRKKNARCYFSKTQIKGDVLNGEKK